MKYFLSLLTFLIIGNSFAQDSTAISETGTWVVYYSYPEMVWDPNVNTYVPVAMEQWYMYQTDGDTTINSVQYKILKMFGLDWDGSNYSTNDPGHPFLAYRNDDSLRAYRVMYGSTTEELWYDFNLDVGDTVYAGSAPAAFDLVNDRIIHSIDSVEYCDSTYRQFHYSGSTSPQYPYNKVAQKVGSLYNLIGNNWDTNVYYELQFFCETPTTVGDLYNLMDVEDEEQFALELYPNPALNTVHIKGLKQAVNYTIFSLDGRNVQEGLVFDQIDIAALETGHYVVVLENTSQVLRFVKE